MTVHGLPFSVCFGKIKTAMNDHLLLRLNPRKIVQCLTPFLPAAELEKITGEMRRNVKQLFRLSQAHYRFALRAAGPFCWRQRVSRGYYSVYNMSRAIRLEVHGYYSVDASDHKKVASLPDDFPSASRWKDFLMKFRADRNLADYDHSVSEKSLELRSGVYLARTKIFLNDARTYLKARGAI